LVVIMLTSRLTVDNPVAIDPATGLGMQGNQKFDTGDDDNDDDDAPILVPNPADSAQAILWRVPAFIWAVATKNITGCTASIADTPSVERWCATIRSRCFGNITTNTPTPMAAAAHKVTPPSASTLETRLVRSDQSGTTG
jgi:hypothetical protein